jgi:DNA-binding NarL/FixJ family response regulator
LKILVVDDHPLVRDAMAQLVAQLADDVTVFEARDCAAGLEAARAQADLDLVLLDLNLPGLRGIPALERFRHEHPAAPVVIISMFRDRETVNEAIRRGAMGFIPKSSGRDTIANALRLVLSGSVYVPPETPLGDDHTETAPVVSKYPIDTAHAAWRP